MSDGRNVPTMFGVTAGSWTSTLSAAFEAEAVRQKTRMLPASSSVVSTRSVAASLWQAARGLQASTEYRTLLGNDCAAWPLEDAMYR